MMITVFKQKAFVRQPANQGPSRPGHFAKRWGISHLFSACLTTILLSGLLFTGLVQAHSAPKFRGCNIKPLLSSSDRQGAHKAAIDVNRYANAGIFKNNDPCFKERKDTFANSLFGALDKWGPQWVKDRLSSTTGEQAHTFFGALDEWAPQWLKERLSSTSGNLYFTDISRFKDQIKTLVDLGMLTPNPDQLFRPNQRISRLEALSMTVKAYETFCDQTLAGDKASPGFNEVHKSPADPNVPKSKSWRKVLNKGYNAGLTTGYQNKTQFAPLYEVPRHETVGFIDKLINQIIDSESCSPAQPQSSTVSDYNHFEKPVETGETNLSVLKIPVMLLCLTALFALILMRNPLLLFARFSYNFAPVFSFLVLCFILGVF
ncbi:MAG: hypothetical protein DRR16_11600 [Candidatus Parabeggiatoa sp. nov. 3]|nr:MAG: hypothetical protein DRR00_20130 [Gammaproteobacteria bacterium]RKZ62117.1 MAG: hypothetical protein DRQ99_19330 [Gammaproteobacteria bacterium]RKZ85639.1 MAG: hypothetical protein DRR16_11600 [Gammaproteobacteria bacterium]HEW97387.1 S-layer homology domain-containing protein [Beggiatoa sp.]